MKIIKLKEDHYIVVDDSEIKEGDWIGFPNLKKFVPVQYFGGDLTGGEKKITDSTQPLDCACSNKGYKLDTNCAERNRCFDKVQYLPLQEVKELLGVVDVEKKAFELYESLNKEYFSGGHKSQLPQTNRERQSICDGFIIGYNQSIEDKREQKYTEQDMINAHYIGWVDRGESSNIQYPKARDLFKQSIQPKTEWEVEFIDGKLKLKQ